MPLLKKFSSFSQNPQKMLFQDHRTWMLTHLIQYKGQHWVVQGCLAMQYSLICHLTNVEVKNYVCFSFECICLPHSSFRCWYQCREINFVQNVIATPYCQSPPSDETRLLYHLHHKARQSPRYRHNYFNRISVLDEIFSCFSMVAVKALPVRDRLVKAHCTLNVTGFNKAISYI